MDLKNKLKDYKDRTQIIPKEQNIEELIRKSMEAYCTSEEGRLLAYHEFLWAQLRLMQKKWWFFQFMLLLVLWAALPSLQGDLPAQRLMGVAASLFIILIIPELWKSRTYRQVEIESVSYYSLRQIYSARILLFGTVDIALISFFCWLSFSTLSFTFLQILIQFVLPMTVTACICFGMLCGKRPFSETVAILMCIGWNCVWLFIVSNEKIYAVITYPVWILFFSLALVFLACTICRTLINPDSYLEGTL